VEEKPGLVTGFKTTFRNRYTNIEDQLCNKEEYKRKNPPKKLNTGSKIKKKL